MRKYFKFNLVLFILVFIAFSSILVYSLGDTLFVDELRSSLTVSVTSPDVSIVRDPVIFNQSIGWVLSVGNNSIRYTTPAIYKNESLIQFENGSWELNTILMTESVTSYEDIVVSQAVPHTDSIFVTGSFEIEIINDTLINVQIPELFGSINYTVSDYQMNQSQITDLYDSLNETEIRVDTNLSQSNISIVTTQHQAVVGQPVKWSKVVHLSESDQEFVELPSKARNVSVVANPKQPAITRSQSQIGVMSIEEDMSTSRSRSQVYELIQSESDFVSEGFNASHIIDTTVFASDEFETLVIEFETPAPTVEEVITSIVKEVRVSSDIHYENVLVYTDISDLQIRRSESVHIFWQENNTYLDIHTISDTTGDGYYDYIEWIAPHLSTQTFQIIVITRAQHLDANRVFLTDIFPEVSQLDGIWSPVINDGEYVRVTFEQNLTNVNDITIFPRIVSGSPRVEVYEKDETIVLVEFNPIIDNQYQQILLTSLIGEQDTFDLRVVDGSVQFDHIIDPLTSINFVSPTPPNSSTILDETITFNVSIQNQPSLQSMSFEFNGTTVTHYDDSLVLMLNLNNNTALGENNSFVFDSSRFENHGSFAGDARPSLTGKYGGSAYFDGTNDWILIPDDPSLDSMSQFTFEAWVYDTIGGAQPRGIASKRINASSSGRAWSIFRFTGGQIFFDIGSDRHSSGVALPTNEWVHLVITFNGSAPSGERKKFYYNGELVGTTASSQTSISRQSTSDLVIGILNPRYSDGWRGYIDEVRIWERTLSETEIQRNFISNFEQVTGNEWKFYQEHTDLLDGFYTAQAFMTNTSDDSFQTEQRTFFVGTNIQYDAPTPQNNSYINQDSFTVNITFLQTPVNTTIRLYNETSLLEQYTNTASYVSTTFTNLNDGVYFFNVTYDDGNTIFESLETRTITIDTLNPVVTFENPTLSDNTLTSQDVIVVNVSVDDVNFANTTVYLYDTDGLVDTVTQSNNPLVYSFTNLLGGTYFINATSFDLAGNIGISETRTIILDLEFPDITIYSPISTIYLDEQILINFTATDNIAIDTLWFFNSTDNVTYSGPQTINLTDGEYTLFFYANDTVGNLAQESITFEINTSASDTIPPVITLISPQNTTYSDNEVLIHFSAIDNVAVDSLWFFNTTDNISYSIPTSVTLPEGTYTLFFYANDTSGNIATTNITFTIDTSFPDVFINTPLQNEFINSNDAVINASLVSSPLSRMNIVWNANNVSLYDSSLQLMYNFDNVAALGDSSTVATDASMYGRDGVITGASYTSQGRFGSAMSFSASNNRVRVENFPALNGASHATISGWVYQNSLSTSQYFLWADGNVLIEFGTSFGTPSGHGPDVVRLRWHLQGNWRETHAVDDILVSGDWNHWAFTFDQGTTRMYLNGNLIYTGSDSQNTISTNSPNYDFGNREGSQLNGRLDEIRIWNRTLTQVEIQEHATTSLQRVSNTEWELISYKNDLSDGQYDVTVSATQNTNLNSSSHSFVIDTIEPTITIHSPLNISYETTTQLVNITANDLYLDSIWFNWNGTNTTYTEPISVSFPFETIILQAWANDTLGNINSTQVTFTIQKTPFNMSFIPPTPEDGSIISSSTILANVSQNESSDVSTFIDLNNQLLGYWNFEYDNQTHVFDNSTYNNPGQLFNSAVILSTPQNIRGSKLRLDSGSNYVRVAHENEFDVTNEFTIEVWVYRDAQDNSWASIFNRNRDDGINLQHNQLNDQFEFAVRTNSGRTHITSNIAGGLEQNRWYHVVGVYTGTQILLYVDGVLQSQGNRQGTVIQSTSPIFIGARGSATNAADRFFNGYIDEVRFWNRSLSVTEIQNSFNTSSEFFDVSFSTVQEGENKLAACGINTDGFYTCADPITIIRDTTSPLISFTSNTLSSNSFTNTSTFFVEVDVIELNIDTVYVDFNGTTQELNCVGLAPNYLCDITLTDLTTGNYSYRVFVNDSVGLTNQTEQRFIFIDLELPTIQINYPINNTIFTDSNIIPLNYTVFDNVGIDICQYSINSGSFVTLANCDNTTLGPFINGLYTLVVEVQDVSGNTNSEEINFEIDLTDIVIIPNYPTESEYHNDSNILFNITTNREVLLCTLSVDGASPIQMDTSDNLTFTSSFSGLLEGQRNIQYNCEDSSSNQETISFSFFVDVTNPSLEIHSPLDNSFITTADISLEFTVVDASPLTCEYSINGNSLVLIPSCSNITIFGLVDNEYTLDLIVTDAAGNTNSSNIFFTIDTQLPLISIHEPIASFYDVQSLSYNISVNEQTQACFVSINGGTNQSLQQISDFNYFNSTSLGDGIYTADFSCIDIAGNVGFNSVSFIVDTVSPVIELVSPAFANGSVISEDSIQINISTTETNDHSVFVDFNSDLLGYWNFETISGNSVLDASSFSSSGNLRNNPTISRINNIRGNYLALNGINQDVSVPFDSRFNLQQNYSVEAWVRHDGIQEHSWASIINRNGNNGFMLHHNNANTNFEFAVGTSHFVAAAPVGGIQIGRWYHIVGTYDGNTIRLYIDGVEVASSVATVLTPQSSSPVYLGSFNGASRWFNGSIDEVRIWNRVLTPQEISSSFNANMFSFEKNFTDLSDGSYSINSCAIDISGNFNCIDEFIYIVNTTIPLFNTNIFLDAPINESVFSQPTIDFTCRATSDELIQNITLLVWNDIDGLIYQDARVTNDDDVEETWTVLLESGNTFEWNCEVSDTLGRTVQANNNNTFTQIMTPRNTNFDGLTTDFSTLTFTQLELLSSLVLENSSFGMIEWLNITNVTGADFDENILFSQNSVFVNSSNLHPSLNSNATITLYNIAQSQPVILRNEQRCFDCDILSFSSNTLVFQVSGFSNYSVVENTSLQIWSNNEANENLFNASLQKFAGEPIEFFANYTDVSTNTPLSTALCTIAFDAGTPQPMLYDSNIELFVVEETFTQGLYQYEITCSQFGFETITLSNSIFVANEPASGDFIVEIFNVTGVHNWTRPEGVDFVDILVVAGGGSGGTSEGFSNAGAGGGGAGGFVYIEDFDVTSFTNPISLTVGAGGVAPQTGNTPGGDGQNSLFANLTALGGGGGSGGNMQGRPGGSGGGSRGAAGGLATQPTSASGGFGSAGGASGGSATGAAATGGGGAGGPGQSLAGTAGEPGGNGGVGISLSITGTPVFYAGGGGGGAAQTNSPVGLGGIGGGGDGGNNNIPPTSGINATGGGGGGGNNNRGGADGGSGVVIIRYVAPAVVSIAQQPQNSTAGQNIQGPPIVLLTDGVGNPISSRNVSVTVIDGTLNAGTTTIQTNSFGLATFSNLQINAAGTYTFNFSVSDFDIYIESQEFTINPAAPHSLNITQQPQLSVINQAILGPPTVELRDIYGNKVFAENVAINVSVNDTSFSSASVVQVLTNQDGEFIFDDLILENVGTYELIFTSAGLVSTTSNSFDVIVSGLSVIQQPINTEAGVLVNEVQVLFEDIVGDPVVGAQINVTLVTGPFASGTISAITNASGIAVFNDLNITQTGSYRLLFENDLTVDFTVSNRFNVTPSQPSSLIIEEQPRTSIINAIIPGPPIVRVVDAFNNNVPNINIVATLNQSSFSAGTTTLTSNAQGLVFFNNLIISEENDYEIIFSVQSNPSITITSDVFSVFFPTLIWNTFEDWDNVLLRQNVTINGTGDDAEIILRNKRYSLNMSGSGAHIDTSAVASDLNVDGAKPRTVSAWAYTRAFDDNGAIFSLGTTGTNTRDFTLRTLGTNNNWRAQFWGAGIDIDFDTTSVGITSLNQWVHFTMTYTGTTVTIYVNGTQVASAARTLNTADTQTFKVGRWTNRPLTQTFNGLIHDVRVYDRALNSTEVGDLASGVDITSGLVLHYPMTEGAGLIVNDASTNSFVGSLSNSPEWSTFTPIDSGVTFETGVLQTDIRSFGSAIRPNLKNLSYVLNGGSINLSIIGSPNTAQQESIFIELSSQQNQSLTWNNPHETFQIHSFFSRDAPSSTPQLNSMALVGQSISQIEFIQQPSNTTINSPISPPVVVLVLDEFGQPIVNQNVFVQLNGGSFSSATINRMTNASGSAVFDDLVIADEGEYNITAFAGLINETSSQFFVNLDDALQITNVTFSTSNFIEGESITVFVNVTNQGTTAVNNVPLQLNISFMNDTITSTQLVSQNISVSSESWSVATFEWVVEVGNHRFNATIDPQNIFSGANENKSLFVDITVPSWHIFFGNVSYDFILQSQSADTFKNWDPIVPIGNKYFADSEAIFEVFNLLPLNESGNLALLDSVFGSTYYNDSFSRLFDTTENGLPDMFMTANIGGNIMDVPVVQSFNSPHFFTGILYDGADGIGYDGTQDIVIVTFINAGQLGSFSHPVDYEVRIPRNLGRQVGFMETVISIEEFN